MITLFIDTSSVNVYIAIVSGDKVLASKEACIPSGHSKYTTSFIKNCLDEAGIDANDINNIMVCNGPGSFTGVRIGVSIAKTYGYLIKKDITPVSSLKELAVSCNYTSDYYLSLISANNGNYYVGLYDSNYNDVIDEKFCDANEVIRLYNEYNSKVISNDFNVVGVIKVNKVNLDFVKIINYYMDKEKVSAHAIVPNYLKLPQVLESK